MVGWLVGRLVCQLGGWVVGFHWLVARFVGSFKSWLIGEMVDWLILLVAFLFQCQLILPRLA
jgi:hypothetical protein